MRGGQRPKERRNCPKCGRSTAIHTWTGELFGHVCDHSECDIPCGAPACIKDGGA